MDAQNSKENAQKEPDNFETLIQMEWDIVHELHKKVKDPDLTTTEMTKASNVLGYHMSNLTKMLNQKGHSSPFDEQNLGEFIRDLQPRTFRRVKRDFKTWTRRLSSRRF
jgi:hypothetical protein